jgi:hypothetical protein
MSVFVVQGQQKSSWKDRATDIAIKTIDHAQAALEGAKQRVTGQTTMPASEQAAKSASEE